MTTRTSASGSVRPAAVAVALVAALAAVAALPARAQEAKVFSRVELTQDARQLADAIERSHPDPYSAGGGIIAFHRRLHDLLRAIPSGGMTEEQFYRYLLPFVARLRDGHTAVLQADDGGPRPGLPLGFRIVDESLVVAAAPESGAAPSGAAGSRGRDLLGAALVAIEGVPMHELVERQNNLRGIENVYGTLALLVRGLRTERGVALLLPEWSDRSTIRVALRLASGEVRELGLASGPAPAATLASRVTMPDTRATDVAWRFLDGAGKTALLEIDDMSAYREGCEAWLAAGMSEGAEMTREAYRRFHRGEPPASMEAVLAGIPSATDAFAGLMDAMRAKGTENLIVDLRANTGGNDLMEAILIDFLFGPEVMKTYATGYQIVRYSDLYFQVYAASRLEEINRGRDLPLQTNDYDFSGERRAGADAGARLLAELKKAPTFYRRYEAGIVPYRPRAIVVLSSAFTYSAGFSMLAALSSLGATVVGTPPAQAGNCFSDSLLFRLRNTQLMCAVAFKQNVTFPDDPERGRCLIPDVRLTFEKLAALGFDPNAEVLLALETLGHPARRPGSGQGGR